MVSLLFVYGILRNGVTIKKCDAENKHIGHARASGYLYNLGPFPGAIFKEKATEKIIGEVYEVSYKTLETLDVIEGVSSGFYRRIKVKIQLQNNEHLYCFAYEYGNPFFLQQRARLIESGDFYQ